MMHSNSEDRADFCWRRALEVRSLAGTLSAAESKRALLKVAEEYERVAEELVRLAVLGDDGHSELMQSSGRR